MGCIRNLGIVLLLFAVAFVPLLQYLRSLTRTPIDTSLGQLERLSPNQLADAYGGKRILVVGGTRGIGKGVAWAIAGAGGDVSIVGRSSASGAVALDYIKSNAKNVKQQKIEFIAGDLGTNRGVKSLVKLLAEKAKTEGKYDYLVVTAAVFPDWKELLNENGIEKAHAISVIGRYAIYRHMALFLKEGGRVLNVLASGEKMASFERELLTAERNVTNLFEAVINLAGGTELMQIGMQESGQANQFIRVSTNPGLLGTDLHDGQGWAMDLFEPIFVALIGISEEECGIRQASILASSRLPKNKISYVDEDLIGRTRSTELQALADKHVPWLMAWLDERTEL